MNNFKKASSKWFQLSKKLPVSGFNYQESFLLLFSTVEKASCKWFHLLRKLPASTFTSKETFLLENFLEVVSVTVN